jgi:regulator of nucleoside diphosphate kinase
MQQVKSRLMLSQEDHDIILSYLKRGWNTNTFNRQDAEELESEIKNAKIVKKEKLPEDVVRLDSIVVIREEDDSKMLEIKLVTPARADIKNRKISIMSPIGTALIGFRKGDKVSWKVPAGRKTFTILEVKN